MKKLKGFFAAVCVLAVCFSLTACGESEYYMFEGQRIKIMDGFEVVSVGFDFVNSDRWEITMPDEVNHWRVSSVVSIPDYFEVINISSDPAKTYSAECLPEKDCVMILNIGENISDIDGFNYSYVKIPNEDGTVTPYRILFYVVCSEKNEKYYSKDGRLYLRSDGTLEPVMSQYDVGENYTGAPGENLFKR